jgi:hypothetical protein
LSARHGPRVRPAGPADQAWIESFLARTHSTRVARRGELVAPIEHPMLVAVDGGEPTALLTYILGTTPARS